MLPYGAIAKSARPCPQVVQRLALAPVAGRQGAEHGADVLLLLLLRRRPFFFGTDAWRVVVVVVRRLPEVVVGGGYISTFNMRIHEFAICIHLFAQKIIYFYI
jgi:hypothetical protein